MNSQCVSARDEAGERGLPYPGWPPENDGAEGVALDLRAQRLARAEDVFLAGVLFERLRTHAVGKRPAFVGAGGFGQRRVEQAHGLSDLWRRASYRMTDAAMAAFSDSTPAGGDGEIDGARMQLSLTPRPSLPMMTAHLRVNRHAAAVSRGSDSRRVRWHRHRAYSAWNAARASSASIECAKGTRNSDPAEARSVFGLYGLACL